MDKFSDIYAHLISIYGKKTADIYIHKLVHKINQYKKKKQQLENQDIVSEKDAILITYGDQVTEGEQKPLQVLKRFADEYLCGIVNGIHILPFFPYSSDDGFSVIDYYAVNSMLGTWGDISDIGEYFKLMVDAVINHISIQSEWFKSFLNDEEPYRNYFITVDPEVDLSQVVRPRALPLLARVDTTVGQKHVWTTFSDDQIDLNFENPEVMLEVIDILLFYISKGAQFIRLDAIAYAWKEIGTKCIHLPQTHRLVELFRQVLDETNQTAYMITETNVPHTENISYFGNGVNEAQLVYNFALPPLLLHGILNGTAKKLNEWAEKLELPSKEATYFNFLASHDGIGLNPARGILSEQDIEKMVVHVEKIGGFISYKDNPDGSTSPYELNVNYYDVLCDSDKQLSESVQINRFVLAHAIMLSFIGLPGIYFHSLVGSKGWPEGVDKTGHKRTINRERVSYTSLVSELSETTNRRSKVYRKLAHLLKLRASTPAFHPFGSQSLLDTEERVFAYKRSDIENKHIVVCLYNLSNEEFEAEVKLGSFFGQYSNSYIDLVRQRPFTSSKEGRFIFKPYQYFWLVKI